MKFKWQWLLLLLPMAVNANEQIPFSQQQIQGMGITLGSALPTNQVNSKQLPGEIVVPVGQERIVSTPQSGLLDVVHVAAGQTVKRGQALAHISSNDLVTLQRDYMQAQTQLRLASNMLERDRNLFREGIIAERRLLTSQSAHEELYATVMQRKQALKLAGLSDVTLKQLDDGTGNLTGGLTLVAPIDGVVLEQMATAGQRVDSSTAIYRLAKLKPLWLEIHAPLDTLAFVKEGMRLNVPKYQAEGKIITIIRNVNKDDQTVHLRAEIDKGAEHLLPGQYVEAVLLSNASNNAYSVPKSAVVRYNKQHYLFVQNSTGFTPVQVDVVSEQAHQVIVSGKLAPQDKIAVTGTVAIKAAWSGIGAK